MLKSTNFLNIIGTALSYQGPKPPSPHSSLEKWQSDAVYLRWKDNIKTGEEITGSEGVNEIKLANASVL
jgi:hypothetical protein